MSLYDQDFYKRQREGSRRSAQLTVPLVLDLLGPLDSVIDVGCGVGTWLSVFHEMGANTLVGIDGDHVDRSLLQIPEAWFRPWNLEQALSETGRYDLAISVEVAEHLSEGRAAGFVEDLTKLAPVVLFSAAIPGQGGVGHINERWPTYWAKLFQAQGFHPVDTLRPALWQNPEVQVWYAQNLLLFASDEALNGNEALKRAQRLTDGRRLSVVHPRLYHLVMTELGRMRAQQNQTKDRA